MLHPISLDNLSNVIDATSGLYIKYNFFIDKIEFKYELVQMTSTNTKHLFNIPFKNKCLGVMVCDSTDSHTTIYPCAINTTTITKESVNIITSNAGQAVSILAFGY